MHKGLVHKLQHIVLDLIPVQTKEVSSLLFEYYVCNYMASAYSCFKEYSCTPLIVEICTYSGYSRTLRFQDRLGSFNSKRTLIGNNSNAQRYYCNQSLNNMSWSYVTNRQLYQVLALWAIPTWAYRLQINEDYTSIGNWLGI